MLKRRISHAGFALSSLFLLSLSLLISLIPAAAQSYPKGEIVFTSDRDGGYGVYVMNVDGSNLKQLVHDASDLSDAAWSPDGASIAFAATRDGTPQIYVMAGDGSDQRRVTNDTNKDRLLWWTLDSKQIVYYSENSADPTATSNYIVNADGSNPQPDKDKVFGRPSPDGKHVVVNDQSDCGMSVANPDGTGKHELPFTGGCVQNALWSPDSKSLLITFNGNKSTELDIIGVDGKGKRTL